MNPIQTQYSDPSEFHKDVLDLLAEEHPEIESVSRFLLEIVWDAGKSVTEAAEDIATCGLPNVIRTGEEPAAWALSI